MLGGCFLNAGMTLDTPAFSTTHVFLVDAWRWLPVFPTMPSILGNTNVCFLVAPPLGAPPLGTPAAAAVAPFGQHDALCLLTSGVIESRRLA